ncbi:putative rna-binding protein fus tls protein [Erysiphe necator]|uniref:Rhodopsin n=1 Tax=Uncinula necator TaxID=52586 RepID=A0A0B1P847_UNCNE|nr:putative rna-binding protein fus tls protein [Erysiphe necator]
MSDNFVPPPGPPPTASPQVPEGYKAQWNEQYKEWFYVNIYTKKSQWEKPKEPAYPNTEVSPPGPPPGYTSDTKEKISDVKEPSQDGTRNTVDSAPGYAQQSLPPREQKPKQGFLGKLLGKANGGSAASGQMNQPPQYGYPQQGYPAQSYPPQGYPPQGYPPQGYPPQGYPQQGYPPQGYPPQGYPQQGYPPQGYPPQGYPPQGYPPQGYPPQGYPQAYGQPAKAKTGGGLGMAGGAALGVGAGLVGGMLLEDAIESHEERIYEQGYQDAQNDDGDFGDDGDF